MEVCAVKNVGTTLKDLFGQVAHLTIDWKVIWPSYGMYVGIKIKHRLKNNNVFWHSLPCFIHILLVWPNSLWVKYHWFRMHAFVCFIWIEIIEMTGFFYPDICIIEFLLLYINIILHHWNVAIEWGKKCNNGNVIFFKYLFIYVFKFFKEFGQF